MKTLIKLCAVILGHIWGLGILFHIADITYKDWYSFPLYMTIMSSMAFSVLYIIRKEL